MKLDDFAKVAELHKKRAYVKELIGFAGPHHSMKLGSYDVASDLKRKLVDPMTAVFKAELADIDEKLAALGVTA